MRRIATLFCVFLAFMTAVFYQWHNNQVAQQRHWETHTYQVMLAAREMRGTLADGGERDDFNRRIAQLSRMTSDNPAQEERLGRISVVAKSYFDDGIRTPEAWRPLLVEIDSFLKAEGLLLKPRSDDLNRSLEQAHRFALMTISVIILMGVVSLVRFLSRRLCGDGPGRKTV
jgi:hypothetical protein